MRAHGPGVPCPYLRLPSCSLQPMPNDLATSLARHLLGRLPAERAYTRADLRAGTLPDPIAGLLEQMLDRFAEYERARHRSEWFDHGEPAVREAAGRYFEALARTARIPAAAWAESLESAVRLVVRHLATPVRALTDAVFQGEPDPLPPEVVRERLALFDAYPYFAEIAGAYLERKHAEALDPDGLFDLLARIDRRVTAGFGPEAWLDLLAPLFALARYVPGERGVPASLLARFFEAKGLEEVAGHLRRREGALDEASLRAVLSGEHEEADEAVRPEHAWAGMEHEEREEEDEGREGEPGEPEAEGGMAREEDEADEEEQASREEEHGREQKWGGPEHDVAGSGGREEPEEEEEHEEERDDEQEGGQQGMRGVSELVPLWRRFAGSDGAQEDAEESEGFEEGPLPLWQRFAGRAQPAEPPAPIPPEPRPTPPDAPGLPDGAPGGSRDAPAELGDLERRVLGPTTEARRRQYVRNLTGGSEADYEAVLRALDRAESWTEAAQVIAQHVFRKHRVDIYSEDAVAFTDAVEARFRR